MERQFIKWQESNCGVTQQPTLQQATQHRKLSARLLSCTYAAKYKAQKSYNKTTDRSNKKAELMAQISGSTILQARPQTPHGTRVRPQPARDWTP
jgi:hypothetical protein